MTYVAAAAAAVTVLIHTLIPDHWLPFVLVARSQGWDLRKTFVTTLASAILHVTLSLGLGLLALFLGEELMAGIGERLETLAGSGLIFFGLVYTLFFVVGGGRHQHYFPGHGEHHPMEDYRDPGPGEPASAGADGPSRPHILRRHLGDRPPGPLALAVVVGLNPCVLAIPLMFANVSHGFLAVFTVATTFALTSIAVLVTATLVGYQGMRRLNLDFLDRWGEPLSGLLIAGLGLVMVLLER
jgi:ABC-type nickel/cobalt efflux system permease component RcnA